MLSSPERPWIWRIWRALPAVLRRRVATRASLLWLLATAALFVTCLASFLVWVADDRSATLAPASGNHESARPGDPAEEESNDEAPPEDDTTTGEAPEDDTTTGEAPEDDTTTDEAPEEESASEERTPAPPSVLPIVVSGVSGVGGLLSGVAAMITVRQAAAQQAPGCTHGGRLPEHRQLDRDGACRRG
ncbi:hypothetical protein ABIE67_004001 [Streptomyces sp. V4I8]|uniref:hypothetical protein n=1 Tax=Streptomyces sp. V4I8 TaxID=3156469 RepID=UPI003515444E